MWKDNLVGGLQAVYTPPSATPPATPWRAVRGEGSDMLKNTGTQVDRIKMTPPPPPFPHSPTLFWRGREGEKQGGGEAKTPHKVSKVITEGISMNH